MPSRQNNTVDSPPLTCEQVREIFHSRGKRSTRPREELYALLAQRHGQHLSAEELFTLIRQTCPGISLATIYNTLDALVDVQLLRRIATPIGRARFDTVLEPHAHVVTADGHVFDVPRDLSDAVFEELTKAILPQIEKRMGIKIDRAALKFLTSATGANFKDAR